MSKSTIESYSKHYEDQLRKAGLNDEQIKQALSIAKQLALDAIHDSRIRDWVWEETSDIK